MSNNTDLLLMSMLNCTEKELEILNNSYYDLVDLTEDIEGQITFRSLFEAMVDQARFELSYWIQEKGIYIPVKNQLHPEKDLKVRWMHYENEDTVYPVLYMEKETCELYLEYLPDELRFAQINLGINIVTMNDERNDDNEPYRHTTNQN